MEFEEIVADVLEVASSDVSDSSGPDTLPAWTSLRHLQLIVSLEEAFGVSFAYSEIRDARTIGDLRRALVDKRDATVIGGAGDGSRGVA